MGLMRRIGAAWTAFTGNTSDIKMGLQSNLAVEMERMRMDLGKREEEIAKLRKEYALRERQADTEVAKAADDAMLGLMQRLGPLLSQLVTMRGIAAEGREVRSGDFLILFGKIEKALLDTGLNTLGTVGEVASFDPKIHQRMSGGDVKEGAPVRIRFVGYQYGNTVVTKGMVSRIE